MKDFIGIVFTLVMAFIIIYFCYFIAKVVSYNVFYEDMVQNTVIEMVKKDCLNKYIINKEE